MAASRKRWTRLSARLRAESSDRVTACSRQLPPSDSDSSLADSFFVTWESVPDAPKRFRVPSGDDQRAPPASNGAAQTAGSTTMSMLAAPLSGTLGWRHTSTGNEALTRE